MNSFKKLFNSMLVLSLCAIGAIEATPKFKRIVQTIEIIPYTGINPLSVLDTNHQKVIDLGLYTPAQAAELDERSFQAFFNSYGIDFSVAAPASNGIRTVVLSTGALLWIPYILGENEEIILTQDTDHPSRTRGPQAGKWIDIQAGAIVVPAPGFTDYTVTSGTEAGAIIRPLSVWGDLDLNLLRKDRQSKWTTHANKFREILYNTGYQLGERTLNQWNQVQFIQSLQITDKCNGVGQGVSGTTIIRVPNNNGPHEDFLHTVDTWFWPKTS
ncbi:MAG TPA: hypothetical protein PLC42_06195 [Parachlamydiaceae bacterium]|nr:hypothetical protein [Parachlamydiaceae bacterium]